MHKINENRQILYNRFKILAELGKLSSRETKPRTFGVASDTLPDNQRSNHFFSIARNTIKNNLIINADSKVVLLTPSCEGSMHDKRIADTIRYCMPSGTILYQDIGFQGFALAETPFNLQETKGTRTHYRRKRK